MAKRTHYANGDEITLACGCDGCNPSMVNGVLCHEHGCPEAWRDVAKECDECGGEFYAETPPNQKMCWDCYSDMMNANFSDEYNTDDDDDDDDDETACETCGGEMDRDCFGNLRCPDCDEPCPGCSDGGGPTADDEHPETFTVNIETGNGVFRDGNLTPETARILREIAERIERGETTGRILDANGNSVGQFLFE